MNENLPTSCDGYEFEPIDEMYEMRKNSGKTTKKAFQCAMYV